MRTGAPPSLFRRWRLSEEHSQFETLRNALSPVDEYGRHLGRAQFTCRLPEVPQPDVDVGLYVLIRLEVCRQGAIAIAGSLENDGAPEIGRLFEMRLAAVADVALENRAQPGVRPNPRVDGADM